MIDAGRLMQGLGDGKFGELGLSCPGREVTEEGNRRSRPSLAS